MGTIYHSKPINWESMEKYFVQDVSEIENTIFTHEKILFYDACSFQYHSKLAEHELNNVITFFHSRKFAVVITRCILMELASTSGNIDGEQIAFLQKIYESGIKTLLLEEESLFDVLSICFDGDRTVNEKLTWAVRGLNLSVSTIKKTFDQDRNLCDDTLKKTSDDPELYKRFFSAVRNNKERDDNLGEEMIAISLYLLSQLPGTKDGKYCIMTDDKGAAGCILNLFRPSNKKYTGIPINIYSTPKMVQRMYKSSILTDKEEIIAILSILSDSIVAVKGILEDDFDIRDKISLQIDELAQMIMTPNMINIIF